MVEEGAGLPGAYLGDDPAQECGNGPAPSSQTGRVLYWPLRTPFQRDFHPAQRWGLVNRTNLPVVNGLQPSCLIPRTTTRQNPPFNHSPKLPEAPPVAINAESEAAATLHSL